MGFFDSFSKKKEASPPASSSSLIAPLPPPAPLNIQNTPSVIPPPPITPNNPVPIQSNSPIPPPVIIPPMPKMDQAITHPVQDDTKQTLHSMTITTITKNTEIEPPNIILERIEPQKKEPSVPDMLPLMPPLSSGIDFKEEYDLKTFNVEERKNDMLPVLNIQEEELPALNVWDMEDKQFTNTRYSGLKKPLFIRTDNYSQVLSSVDMMKGCIEESNETIYSLENLKKNADIEHKTFKMVLEDIQRKIIYVDKVLFKEADPHA